MKYDLPFFEHDNNALSHAKMQALLVNYGFEGYGRFWALNERIASSTHCILNLSTKVERAGLAAYLRMMVPELDQFLAFLADPEECGLITLSHGLVTTDRTQANYLQVSKNRVEAQARRKKALEAKNGMPPAAPSPSPPDLTTETPVRPNSLTETPSSLKSSPELDKSTLKSSGELYKNQPTNQPTNQRNQREFLAHDRESGSPSAADPFNPEPDFTPSAGYDPEAADNLPALASPDLQTSIRKSFQSKNPVWPNAQKQVAAIENLTRSFTALAETKGSTPEQVALTMIERFWTLTQTGRDFFRKQPFEPTRMVSLWGDILAEASPENDFSDISAFEAFRSNA